MDGDGRDDCWGQWYFGTLDGGEQTTDADGDGLLDSDEYFYRMDPNLGDSDDDGYTDAEEVAAGSNPTDPQSTPGTIVSVPASGFLGFLAAAGLLLVIGVRG